MSNEDDTIHIVFNGEIYNYKELRDELSYNRFTSETDTEVLLKLYEEYGVDCLDRLRGMFAFTIWDENKERLFLARDRLGQKPLFYRLTDDAFTFGSTIGAILTDINGNPHPDLPALRSYINYQYVPSPKTGFESIRQLQAGEYMTVTSTDVNREKYWSISYSDQFSSSPSILADRFKNKLREATRLRLRSDVPLGVFLSGGLDSSVVTALMSELSDSTVQTYSIGFDVEKYNELEFARTVANEFDTNHTEYTLSADSMLDTVSALLDHYQMPFGDTSALPTYHVSRLASEHITVALTGDGGDEALAGYDRYRYDKILSKLHRVPEVARMGLFGILDNLPAPYRGHQLIRMPRLAIEAAGGGPVERYASLVCKAQSENKQVMREENVDGDRISELRSLFYESDAQTRLDQLLYVDVNMNLPDRLLVKTDRASMAHSLEARSPFLDHKLAEFVSKVPSQYKLKGSKQKWLMKKAFEDDLPEKIISRPKKGFGVPMDDWTRGKLRDFIQNKLNQLGSRPPYDSSKLDRLMDEHLSKAESHGSLIWNLMMLEMWYERYIDD